MTDLPSDRAYIQSEETDTESPVSEQLLQKIGSAVNFLNDRYQLSVEEFTSNGTFTPPEGVDTVLLIGCGGGGGGNKLNDRQSSAAHRGSCGAILYTRSVNVTPLTNYAVTIGAGGAAGGGRGGNTTFGSLATFEGGSGADIANQGSNLLLLDTDPPGGGSSRQAVQGVIGCFKSAAVNSKTHVGPRPNNGNIPPAAIDTDDEANLLRGGTGPFGIGGAGGDSSAGAGPANTGAGGGSTALSGTGAAGGSGRLIVVF